MSGSVSFAADQSALLAAAAEWRLMGLLLERPRPEWRVEVEQLAAETRRPTLRRLARLALMASEGDYLRWFGPGGLISPRAAAYRTGDPGQLIAQLRGFYAAFAYHPRSEDPPDHLAVMSGFLAFLRLKQAFAGGSGHADGAATTTAAITMFITEQLGPVAGEIDRRFATVGRSWLTLIVRYLARRAELRGATHPRPANLIGSDAFAGTGADQCGPECCPPA